MIDPQLLEILACPACKTEVKLEVVRPAAHDTSGAADTSEAAECRARRRPASPAGTEPARSGERLVCVACGRRYPIRDGIPVMLIDEAEQPAGKAGAAARS